MRRLETAAREKFRTAVAHQPEDKPPDGFFRQLDEKIIPAFSRIGFDSPVARVIFQAAQQAWRNMGPLTPTILWCHPALIKDIRQVRSGIISTADGGVRLQRFRCRQVVGDPAFCDPPCVGPD